MPPRKKAPAKALADLPNPPGGRPRGAADLRPEDLTPDQIAELESGRGLFYREIADARSKLFGYEEVCWYYPNIEHGDLETRELKWRKVPADEYRCRAVVKGRYNPWRGAQCAKSRVKGMRVCVTHGGSLPQAKAAAQRRLTLAADPAAKKLVHIAIYDKNTSDADRIRAILAILDRAGVQGKTTVEIEVAPWQKAMELVYRGMTGGEGKPEADIEAVEGVDYEVMEEEDDAD